MGSKDDRSLPNGTVPSISRLYFNAENSSLHSASNTCGVVPPPNCVFYFPPVQHWAAKRRTWCSTGAGVCKILWVLVHHWISLISVCPRRRSECVIVVTDVIAATIAVFLRDETPPIFCRCLLQAVTPAASHVQTSFLPPMFVFFIPFFKKIIILFSAICTLLTKSLGTVSKVGFFFFCLFCVSFPPNFRPKFNKCICRHRNPTGYFFFSFFDQPSSE